jgi:hydroxymethylbilane synthase
VVLKELRGNVPTRIEKLDRGDYDAIVLAAAGVKRLGLPERISSYLPMEHVMPAVSQGAVAVQIRDADERVLCWIGPLDHVPTRVATDAERSLLRTLEGGCQVPVGALARVEAGQLELRATVCAVDGSRHVEGTQAGPVEEALDLGVQLAERLLAEGADSILEEIRAGLGGEA